MRPHRRLRLLAGETAILDGQIPQPTIGRVGTFWLLFEETGPDEHDPTLSTIEADAEPLGPPRPQSAPDTPPSFPRTPVWRIFLRGDGWSATWYSHRPAVGRVRLTGRFIGDFAYATTGKVRGRAVSTRRLDETASAGRHEPGVLTELDLDDVPPLEVRPSILPRTISAADRILWVADEQLPLVLRIDLNAPDKAHKIVLPASIAPEPNRRPWQLHADSDGCWVAGWYGVFRCDDAGTVRHLDERRVDESAAHHGVLLTRTGEKDATRLGIWGQNGEPTEATIPAGPISTVTGHSDGFRILMRNWNALPHNKFIVDVAFDGQVTIGPEFDGVDDYAILTPDASRVIDLRGTVRTVRPDLRLDAPTRWSLPGLTGGTVGEWVWVEHHDADRDLRDTRTYWLLSIVDPMGGRVVATTEIRTAEPSVTIDSTGIVWVVTDDATIVAAYAPDKAFPITPVHPSDLVD